MRRSASEIIRNLETRIARLEKQSGRSLTIDQRGFKKTLRDGQIYTITVQHKNSSYEDEILHMAWKNDGEVVASGSRESEVHFKNKDDGEEFAHEINLTEGLKIKGKGLAKVKYTEQWGAVGDAGDAGW